MNMNLELSRRARRSTAQVASLCTLLVSLACTNTERPGLPEVQPGAVSVLEQGAVQTELAVTSSSTGRGFSYSATLPPAAVVGTISQTLEASWNPNRLGLSQAPIVPQGWSLTYYAGSTQLPGEPVTASQWAQVSRVVTTGALNVEALDGERQALISNVTAPVAQVASSFSGGSAGDGWDVFFDPGYTRIFNIHHHNSPSSVMCRMLADGSTCPGFPIELTQTSFRSTGRIHAESNKLWQPTITSGARLGWDCVDLTTAARCATPTVLSIHQANDNSYNNHTDPVVIGRKMYALGYVSGGTRITCLDMVTGVECAGMALPQNGGFSNAGIEAVGNKLYVLPGANLNLDCYDSTTWTRCAGSWPRPAASGPVWAVRSGDGVVRNVCANSQCFSLDGSAHSLPPNFAAYLAVQPVQAVLGSASSLRNKAAWSIGGRTTCWDMTTDQKCADPFPINVNNIYATVLDPDDPDCLWTNGDDGVIRNFKISTGAPGCGGGPAQIRFRASTAIPRLSCDPESRVYQYRSFKLTTPEPSQYTSATLTVRDSNGLPIPGWTGLAIPASNAPIDLTTLSPSVAGGTPYFDVSVEGFTATGVTPAGEFRVTTGSPPQLCWELAAPALDCPSTPGLARDTSPAPVSTPVTVDGSFSTNSGTNSFPGQVLNTRLDANAGNCGTRLRATVVELADGSPVSGARVFLFDGAGNPILDANNQPVSAVSAADGTVEFSVWAANYTLKLTGNTLFTPVSMNVTAGGSGLTYPRAGTVVSNAVTTTLSQPSHVRITVTSLAPSPPALPCAPVVTSPPGGTVVYREVNPLMGTADPGATVTVRVNGQPVCTVVANSQGQWSCEAALPVGTSTVDAIARDGAGNISDPSSGVLITRRDRIGRPIITGPPAVVREKDVTVTGTSEPNANITVTDEEGKLVCTAKADDTGAWQCDATLTPGPHQLTASAEWRDFQSTSNPHDTTLEEDVWFEGSGCTSAGSAQPALLMMMALGGLVLLRRRRQ
jgi:MYXO-CTERM domain-containing protein